MARNLTVAEFELLKKAGYPEKAIDHYQKLNVGKIYDSNVNLDYTGSLRRHNETILEN